MRASILATGVCVVVALAGGCVFEERCVEGATRDASGRCVARTDGGADGGPRDGSMDTGVIEGGTDAGMIDAGATDAGLDGGCGPAIRSFPVVADTQIFAGACIGANHAGAFQYLNLNAGSGLFRFQLDDDARSALAASRVVGARLVLQRHRDCDAPGMPCPAAAGSLRARPMRSDWDEGSDGSPVFVAYAGCDWCRRAGGMTAVRWGADGATAMGIDVGPYAGTASFDTAESTVAVPLDPADFYDWLNPATSLLSIQTVPETGTLVVASRETSAEPPAALELDVCPL